MPSARVVVGVRPEHVRICQEKPAAAALSFSAEVVHGEPLGAETYLYLDASGTRIAARLPGWGVFSPRDSVTCAVDVRHCLFFDAATGTRLVEARG